MIVTQESCRLQHSCSAELHGNCDACMVSWGWLGDSRAVLCQRDKGVRLTEDHKPNLPGETARIKNNGGQVEFQACWRVVLQKSGVRPKVGLAVSRCLGDLVFKEPNRLHKRGIKFFFKPYPNLQNQTHLLYMQGNPREIMHCPDQNLRPYTA